MYSQNGGSDSGKNLWLDQTKVGMDFGVLWNAVHFTLEKVVTKNIEGLAYLLIIIIIIFYLFIYFIFFFFWGGGWIL